MASAFTTIVARRGWARNAVRIVQSLRDRADRPPTVTEEDETEFRDRRADRESALLDAILRGYITP